jgi:hypothetical protein
MTGLTQEGFYTVPSRLPVFMIGRISKAERLESSENLRFCQVSDFAMNGRLKYPLVPIPIQYSVV